MPVTRPGVSRAGSSEFFDATHHGQLLKRAVMVP